MTAHGAIILAIETSNPSAGLGSVAVGRVSGDGAEVLAVEAVAPCGRHDDALVPTIARACAEAGVGPCELARVVVSIGPGGFSGLRIAAATAKMIALAAGAECVAVPSALVAAEAARVGGGSYKGPALVALAGKRDTAWVVSVDPGSDTRARASAAALGVVMDAGGLRELIGSVGPSVLIADEHLPGSMRDEAGRAGLAISPPRFDAAVCLTLGAAIEAIPAAGLNPIYPREPEAVRKWRDMNC